MLVGAHWVTPLALSQRAIYADVLEGVPDREINDRYIASELEMAKRMHGLAPAFIIPEQRQVSSSAPSKVALPSVVCIGRFRSLDPAHDPSAERSEACIVWCQEQFAFPIDSAVENKMLQLDWTQFSRDDFM